MGVEGERSLHDVAVSGAVSEIQGVRKPLPSPFPGHSLRSGFVLVRKRPVKGRALRFEVEVGGLFHPDAVRFWLNAIEGPVGPRRAGCPKVSHFVRSNSHFVKNSSRFGGIPCFHIKNAGTWLFT